jgi:hypothetical protein
MNPPQLIAIGGWEKVEEPSTKLPVVLFTNYKRFGNKKGFVFLSMVVGQKPANPGTSPAGLPLLLPT